MKTVILAGGLGTRISEESHLKPKPMIEIGGAPILWHIMKYYSAFGFNDFIICCGYKGYVIKKHFADYYLHRSDVTFDFANGGGYTIHKNSSEPWRVTVVDTGINTMTGGRLKRIRKYLANETFMMTYGDGVSTVDLNKLLSFHESSGKLATLTAVQPGGRFGVLNMDKSGVVNQFTEKAKEDGGWINAGFMVLSPKVIDYIDGDQTFFEREPLEKLANDGELAAYRHNGFWKCMDTLRDKEALDFLLASNCAPWKIWKD